MTSNNSNSRTGQFRSLFRFGFHPAATQAAILLRIISTQPFPSSTENDYHLCDFTTEAVLSFCIDPTRVIVVDVTKNPSDFSSSNAPTCLVVDDLNDTAPLAWTAWSQTFPPKHLIFGSMPYHRALDWLNQSKIPGEGCVSIDMLETHSDDSDPLNSVRYTNIVELTLPSTVVATSVAEDFLQNCRRLTYLDMSSLTNVCELSDGFLCGCSAFTTLDLSPLKHVAKIGDYFLHQCSALTSLDLSPLKNVTKIDVFFPSSVLRFDVTGSVTAQEGL
eukprot:PhM_4_TR18654/c0_g1_i1/m.75767